jgi:outer membrane protein assembly factor BamE (lipoprotein component of BamABCDE complex)
MNFNLKLIPLLLLPLLVVLTSCNTASNEYNRNTGITHGTVQLHLQKGVTSQTEVLEKFGSPNIATTDGDMEVWTYQRHGTTSKSAGVGGSLILLGGSTSGFSQNSRTMTLIIKFGTDKKVVDFNSRYSSF